MSINVHHCLAHSVDSLSLGFEVPRHSRHPFVSRNPNSFDAARSKVGCGIIAPMVDLVLFPLVAQCRYRSI
jgi:hypothetical protein